MNNKVSFFSKNLKWIRKHHKISQEQLASNLDLKRNNIASYELGNSSPNLLRAISIARYFNLPLEVMVLTNFEETPPKLKQKSLIEERIEDMIQRKGESLNSWKAHIELLSSILKGYETMASFDSAESIPFSFSHQNTTRVIRLLNKDKTVMEQMVNHIEDEL